MSTIETFRDMNIKNQEGESSYTRTSFYKSGDLFQSAYLAKSTQRESPYNLLTFLSVVQCRGIDLLPITWEPALDSVGAGRTAEIRQSLINIQLSFAFKRVHLEKLSPSDKHEAFDALTSEILVLGHPEIRRHLNIVRIEGVCWDFTSDIVWPVLVFKKSQYGDLKRFMNSEPGKQMGIKDRLKLCRDIAAAISLMHSCHVIHGDIKPQNVLIFKDNAGNYTARVSDFGYSTISLSQSADERIILPRSKPWNAPEIVDWATFSFTQAKLADAYSFGMLCLWLLFYNRPPENSSSAESVSEERHNLDFLWIGKLKQDGELQAFARARIEETTSLSQSEKNDLHSFFALALSEDQKSRKLELGRLLSPVGAHQDTTLPYAERNELDLLHHLSNFQLAGIFRQVMAADYRLWEHILKYLESQTPCYIDESLVENIAFQLAFCYEVCLGCCRSPEKSMYWLEKSKKKVIDLEEKVNAIRTDTAPFYKSVDVGIGRIDFVNEYRRNGILQCAQKTYEARANDMEHTFGNTHPITIDLKSTLASILTSQGNFNAAEALLCELIEIHKETKGLENTKTADSMNDLAHVYWNQGRWKEAEEIGVQATKIFTHVLGPNHPSTLASLANLASTYSNQGQWKVAESLEEHTMNTRKMVLGLEHPDTLMSMANLATTYRRQGHWKLAERLELQVLEMRKKVIGPEHPETLTSVHNLASTLSSLGRWKEAEQLEVPLVEARKRLLGLENPETLMSMTNLASTYRDLGRLKEAEELEKQVVHKRKEVLGLDHPDTLMSMGNLALTYMFQERFEEAEELQVQVLEPSKRILGLEHPETLTYKINLAMIYGYQGQLKEAEKLQMEVMETRKRLLGSEHPDTLISMLVLASTLWDQGRLDEAEQLEVQVVKGRKRLFGPEHPSTIKSMHNLAMTFLSQERWRESEELQLQVVELSQKVLGLEHPETLCSMDGLAMAYKERKCWEPAEKLEAEALSIRKRILGLNHPDTLENMENLISTYKSQGRQEAAEALEILVAESSESSAR